MTLTLTCQHVLFLFLTALYILCSLCYICTFIQSQFISKHTHTHTHTHTQRPAFISPTHFSHSIKAHKLSLTFTDSVSSSLFPLRILPSPSWFYYTDSSIWQLWPTLECYTYTHSCTHTDAHAYTQSHRLLPSPAGTCNSYPCRV